MRDCQSCKNSYHAYECGILFNNIKLPIEINIITYFGNKTRKYVIDYDKITEKAKKSFSQNVTNITSVGLEPRPY